MKTTRGSSRATSKSRRNFTKSVAVSLIAAPLVAHAQRPETNRESPAPPKPQASPSPAAGPQLSPGAAAVAAAYFEVARLRFGEKLGADDLARIRQSLERYVGGTSEALRKAKLRNSDEPDFVFKA